jgi:ribose transport system ATP-binding protein
MSEPLVSMEGIDKSFPGVRALDQARFELCAGEVHALVGENGAGKSTLMKVLAGVYRCDAGAIRLGGTPVVIASPRAALGLGISIIHQELNLVPHLTVAQNIFLGREPRRRPRFVLDERALDDAARAVLDRLRVGIDPRTRVSDLTVGRQQMVEIARALSLDARVLIMDEPTASLTTAEIDELFRITRELRARGVGIVHISHRLEELPEISDRITVMRDGRTIDTLETRAATPERRSREEQDDRGERVALDRIIQLMVGRTIYEAAPKIPELPEHEVVLELRRVTRGRAIRDVSFSLRRGEILGVAGLVGAGRTEVARAIFGADRIDSGEILVRGRPVRIRSPRDAVRFGIGYVSEDRKRYGLALGMAVETNIALATLRRCVGWLGTVNTAATHAMARRYADALQIRTPSLHHRAGNLSGGNQQKVVIAKWLAADTDILLFDEPTRGIDVGAKSEIYQLMNELTRQGKSILMISSELTEVLRMSHRILVMCEGRITAELPGGASQEQIMTYATRRTAARAEHGPADAPR